MTPTSQKSNRNNNENGGSFCFNLSGKCLVVGTSTNTNTNENPNPDPNTCTSNLTTTPQSFLRVYDDILNVPLESDDDDDHDDFYHDDDDDDDDESSNSYSYSYPPPFAFAHTAEQIKTKTKDKDNVKVKVKDKDTTKSKVSSNPASKFEVGGKIQLIETLFNCNILAIVIEEETGTGTNISFLSSSSSTQEQEQRQQQQQQQQQQQRQRQGQGRVQYEGYQKRYKVLIYDRGFYKNDNGTCRIIGEMIFYHPIYAVKLRRDRICVALHDTVHVYDLGSGTLLDTIGTGFNSFGLLSISLDDDNHNNNNNNCNNSASLHRNGTRMVLACPSESRKKGRVQVKLYGKGKTLLIDAHESDTAAVALTVDGTFLATASKKGTIIRLFLIAASTCRDDLSLTLSKSSSSSSSLSSSSTSASAATTPPGALIREFRRGFERAKIESLSFSLDKCWLSCISDHGTIHIFPLGGRNSNCSMAKNQRHGSRSNSFTSSLKKIVFQGEESCAQVKGMGHPKMCTFVDGRPNTIAVVGLDEVGNVCFFLASFCQNERAGSHTYNSNSSGIEAARIENYQLIQKLDHNVQCNNYSNGENDKIYGQQLMHHKRNDKIITNGINVAFFVKESTYVFWYAGSYSQMCRIVGGTIGKPVGKFLFKKVGWNLASYSGQCMGICAGKFIGFRVGKYVGSRLSRHISIRRNIVQQIDNVMEQGDQEDRLIIMNTALSERPEPSAPPLPEEYYANQISSENTQPIII